MKIKNRIFFYIDFAFVYIISSAFISIKFSEIFKNLTIGIIVGIGLLNLIFAFLFLKLSLVYNIVVALAISTISALMVYLVDYLKLAPSSDAYGIMTSVMTLTITSVLLWELFYQLKLKCYQFRQSRSR